MNSVWDDTGVNYEINKGHLYGRYSLRQNSQTIFTHGVFRRFRNAIVCNDSYTYIIKGFIAVNKGLADIARYDKEHKIDRNYATDMRLNPED